MDSRIKVLFWIYGGAILLLFILVIIALTLANVHIEYDNIVFSFEKVGNILGIIISVFGLLVTSYFVVLAIDAYSHIKEIRNCKNLLESLIKEWQKQAEETNNKMDVNDKKARKLIGQITESINNYSDFIYNDLAEQIALEGQKNITKTDKLKRRNSLFIRQSRLSYLFPMLENSVREKLLLQLGDIGEEEDLEAIRKITQDENEPKRLRDIAELVYDQLKRKLNK